MPDHRTLQEAGCSADQRDPEGDSLARVLDELARLRAENDDLRCRVRRLEARSGRGLLHPSDYADIAAGPGG